jgi:hypothetical protein
VSGFSVREKTLVEFVTAAFSKAQHLTPCFFLYNHFTYFWLLTMRPMVSIRLDSVSVGCKSICLG